MSGPPWCWFPRRLKLFTCSTFAYKCRQACVSLLPFFSNQQSATRFWRCWTVGCSPCTALQNRWFPPNMHSLLLEIRLMRVVSSTNLQWSSLHVHVSHGCTEWTGDVTILMSFLLCLSHLKYTCANRRFFWVLTVLKHICLYKRWITFTLELQFEMSLQLCGIREPKGQ